MTTRYATSSALRAALDSRTLAEARRIGRDPNWLRRRVAFTRLLVRLADHARDAWVLKGGMAVELRRPGLARATRDLDLVLRPGLVADTSDAAAVRDVLTEALAVDQDRDGFAFRVGSPSRLKDDAYGRPAWRFAVEALLAGRQFAPVRLDVVARPEELDGVEPRPLPDLLSFAGVPTRTIWVADLRQQYAEKLHALTRTYESGASTRVKDLVDLVLLIEDGVPADTRVVAAVRRVFHVRRAHPFPTDLGSPPEAWREPFRRLAAEVALCTTSHQQAHDLVAAHWQGAREAAAGEDQLGT